MGFSLTAVGILANISLRHRNGADLESSLIGDPKFAKPLNYRVLKVKNLKQTPKQDLDFLMARKKGSASTVILSEEQLKDICGEGSLVCVPRRWLKELGFDPEQERKARVLGVHPDGKEVWEYTDWRTLEEKAWDWESNHPLSGVVPLADRIANGELNIKEEELEFIDLINFERKRKARLYDMGPELVEVIGDYSDEQIAKELKEVIRERLDPDSVDHFAPDYHRPIVRMKDEEG